MLLNDRLELVGSVVKVGGKVGGGSSVVEGVSGVARISSMPSITGGGPQRSSCGPVSRRVRLGWRSTVECKGVGACHLVSQRGCKVQCRATGRPMNGSPTIGERH